MLQALPEAQRAQAAASMNLSVDQLQQFTQLLSSLPPDQLQNMMGAAGLGGQGGVPPGADVVRLTPEELAAVRRLQELGFSEQQAVQAFIACDRNETLAANFLFDGGVGDFGDGGDMDDYDEHY
jgi:UV excision repair protein RAD23